mgnify:CR=1 FL=1
MWSLVGYICYVQLVWLDPVQCQTWRSLTGTRNLVLDILGFISLASNPNGAVQCVYGHISYILSIDKFLLDLQSHVITIDADSTVYVSSIVNSSWYEANKLQGLTDVMILDETSQRKTLGTTQRNISLKPHITIKPRYITLRYHVYYICNRSLKLLLVESVFHWLVWMIDHYSVVGLCLNILHVLLPVI